MGLAASQARFLNLTARKTNIEYEGQQINQQRTTLSNQSANYYNSMLTLTVPTPPSTDSYKRIVYTVSDGAHTYNIYQISKKAGSEKYTVSYTTTNTEQRMLDTNKSYNITTDSGVYKANNKKLSKIADVQNSTEIANVLADIQTQKGDTSLTKDNIYVMNLGTDSSPKYVYFLDSEVINAAANNESLKGSSYQDVTEYIKGSWDNATIARDTNNRIVSIQTNDFQSGTEVAVTSTSITDNDAYEDAYNEYTYQTYLYQQELEQINAQTSIIQAQDKKLELRLKQLDTEEAAIKTEMDSISSVLKNNIEKSFNVFS